MMEIMVSNPNFSVVLPVGCNASCSFCYWEQNSGLTLDKFEFVINRLPSIFKQISITGGEPTLCYDLEKYIELARDRFDKVVLNTNGYLLTEKIASKCDFVNISRHHYDDCANNNIFNTNSVPDTTELKEVCKFGNITLNCFLPSGFDNKEFINKYIDFAKELNAKVAFRKNYKDLDILSSVDTDDTLIDSHECPACLHRRHLINDVHVTFKYSVPETFELVNGIYELILQPTGDLTFDWKGQNKLNYKENTNVDI